MSIQNKLKAWEERKRLILSKYNVVQLPKSDMLLIKAGWKIVEEGKKQLELFSNYLK